MRPLFAGSLELWRGRPVAIHSPLSPEAAADRLRTAQAARGMWYAGPSSLRLGPRIVTGRVSRRDVVLAARRSATGGNAWRPIMHARLSPARGGCQLLGAFAWHPFARVFSALWLGLSGCFVLIGLAMTVASAVAGRWSFASSALAFTGVTAGIAALAVVLIQVAVRLGERDEQFLRTWLAERLESRGDRQPGHGPREPDAP